jgi:Asp-tRNA(Asn)/Glu-tRNA(Gln) amidotransferase A subunit family amidase
MTMQDILGGSAATQAALIRSGEISARELVRTAVDQIANRDREINAFARVCSERALAEADTVRADMVALADGSDLGGSIRIPASCCGVVGLKPSRGRVSIGPDLGDVGAGAAADGPIARTVLDTAIALDAMAGYEAGDNHWIGEPACSFSEAVMRPPAHLPIHVALDAPLGVPVDDEPKAAANVAADLLAELGHNVCEQSPDWNDERFPATWATFPWYGSGPSPASPPSHYPPTERRTACASAFSSSGRPAETTWCSPWPHNSKPRQVSRQHSPKPRPCDTPSEEVQHACIDLEVHRRHG